MPGVGLGHIVSVLSRFESRNVHVDPIQCSRLRHKNATCSRCADHCPEHALTWERTLQIDQEKCAGCGICTAVCPTGALESANPTNAELLERIEQRRGTACLAFACSKGTDRPDERVIPVNCLGRLDEAILVGAASWGIKQILLVNGPCQDCPKAIGHTASERAVAESKALLRAFSFAARIAFVPQLPATAIGDGGPPPTADGMSRRAFFTMLTRETKVAAALTMSAALNTEEGKETETKKGELPQREPVKRLLLLQALRRLGQPASADFQTQNAGWATCHINEKCTGCQMCAFFCPTGALSKTQQDDKPALSFRVAECTNCRVCQEICFWNALELTDRIDLGQVLSGERKTFIIAGATARESPEAKLKRLIQSAR